MVRTLMNSKIEVNVNDNMISLTIYNVQNDVQLV